MNDKPLLSVDEARSRILASAGKERPTETIALEQAIGRTLARNLTALRTQPPTDMSAMDGYALRTQDLAQGLVKLREIGVSTAGHGFAGSVGPGEAVRIFTGAPIPPGADAVLVQENAQTENGVVEPLKPVAAGRNIRLKGVDFSEGDPLLRAGARLNAASLALAAAMNHAHVTVTRRPRVAILATGDELVRPGEPIGPDQIVATNSYAVAALVEAAGGEPQDLGIAKDELSALERAILTAREAACDLLVTLGGASVGDYDLVQPALAKQGIELDFWKIAMRPGKPVFHGRIGPMIILGLPGNPAAALVAGYVFLVPLVRALCGDPHAARETTESVVLGCPLGPNDQRQDYLRSALELRSDGLPVATPFELQDSSLLRIFAQSQCLVIRPPQAPAAQAGDLCQILRTI